MVCTEISRFLALRDAMAVRSRSTVASLRAVVDCLIPASCASEYVRGKGGAWRLAFGFIASLQLSVGRGKYFEDRAEITKNHMPGTIVLSSPKWARLKEYTEEDRATLARTYDVDWNGPIFLSDSHRNPGRPITKWTVKDIFDRIRDEVHLPQLTPHKMRHLMLTELKKSGMDLLEVSRYG